MATSWFIIIHCHQKFWIQLFLVNGDTKHSNDSTMLKSAVVNREKKKLHHISETKGVFY